MRQIIASANCVKGTFNRYFNHTVGAGRAHELLRHEAALQLKTAVEECGFRYIRFHGIFNEDMAVCIKDEHDNIVYNYQYVDMLFDFLLDIGIRPFLELGFMPKCLASGEQTVFFWSSNVTPPADYEQWRAFITDFIRHITLRYGEDEIKKWFFEVWNEPNHPGFYSESKDYNKYFELYKVTVEAVKSVCPDYKVGGPATAGMIWFDIMIDWCRENNVPIDFFSGHCYCVAGDFDEDGKKDLFLLDEFDALVNPIKKHTKMADDAGLPMYITEWSSSYSSRDPIHDTYINAPFVLDVIKQLDGFADSLSYWVYTDIFEEQTPPLTPFHGGFGILNTQSLKKPTYYSFKFLNEMGNTELVSNDGASYVCKNDDGEIEVLFWNYERCKQNKQSNRTFYKKLLPANYREKASVEISDLAPGLYRVFTQEIGFEKGDVYSAYVTGDYGKLETRESTEVLRRAAEPDSSFRTVMVGDDGRLLLEYETFDNQVDFLKIEKIG